MLDIKHSLEGKYFWIHKYNSNKIWALYVKNVHFVNQCKQLKETCKARIF